MNFRIFATVLFWPGLALVFAQAQDAGTAPPQPVEPFIAKVPEYGHWTIQLKHLSPPSAPGQPPPAPVTPADEPVLIDVIKAGKRWQVTQTFPTGKSQMYDQAAPDYILQPGPGGLQVITIFKLGGATPYPYFTTGFLFAEWVHHAGLAAFQEVAKINNVPCFHYHQDVRDAWIAVDTLLPVKTAYANLEATFEFRDAPTGPLVFSPEEEAYAHQRAAEIKAMSAVR